MTKAALTAAPKFAKRLFSRPQTLSHKAFFGVLYAAAPFLTLYALYLLDRPYELDEAYQMTAEQFVVSYSDVPPATGWRDIASNPEPRLGADDPFMSVWYEYLVPGEVETPTLYFPMP